MPQNKQYAPYPFELEAAVQEFRYVEGWRFKLHDLERDFADPATRKVPISGGLTFSIYVPCYDAYHPEIYRPVHHLHPVPAATFNRSSWERWVRDRLMQTIEHEAMEHARFETGQRVFYDDGPDYKESHLEVRRPWAPLHGPGDDPYVLHDLVSSDRARVSWLGQKNAGDPLKTGSEIEPV